MENSDIQSSIVDAVCSVIGFESTRIAGFLRIECGLENPRELFIDFNRLSNSSAQSPSPTSPQENLSIDCDASVDSGIQIPDLVATSTPFSFSSMPKTSRRKAYLPKRVVVSDDWDVKRETDLQSSPEEMNSKLSQSLPIFPSQSMNYLPSMASIPRTPSPKCLTNPSIMKARILTKTIDGKRKIKPKPIRPQNRPVGFTSRSVNQAAKRSQTKEFACNQCVLKFRSLGSLTEHTNLMHGCFRCMECNAKFTQRSNLQRHTLKHLGYKPFKCSVCEKEYYRKDHLVRHIEITHPGSMPRDCIVNVLPTAECLRRAEEDRQDNLENYRLNSVTKPEAAAVDKSQPNDSILRQENLEIGHLSSLIMSKVLSADRIQSNDHIFANTPMDISDEPQDLSMNTSRGNHSDFPSLPNASIGIPLRTDVYDFSH